MEDEGYGVGLVDDGQAPLLMVLPMLIEGLEADDNYDKVESLYQLAQIIDS